MGQSGSRMCLVGESILISESGGKEEGVEVGCAIASSVFGCMVHVWRVLGNGSPGVVNAKAVV